MPQYRLTQKFAKDCKVKIDTSPLSGASLLDDWIMDVFTIRRKKFIIATHVATLFTLFIPYADINGAKEIFTLLPRLLYRYLYQYGYTNMLDDELRLFSESPLILCKTEQRRVLGHMNDFKWCTKVHVDAIPCEHIDWDEAMHAINNMPVNVAGVGYSTPFKLLKLLIEQKVQHQSTLH